MSNKIAVDEYVITVLMRDLVGHDRMPSAFLVYLHLWGESERLSKLSVRASHQMMAESTGLSKSAVQKGIRCLVGRKLLRTQKESPTAIPEYRVVRPWRR
ncbi:MAG: helix-turn-helix domain-containing protein [Acidobacteriota bacterium]|nr:helix-turn-helix domain-containing protein [Acidobacteriota bacterium]